MLPVANGQTDTADKGRTISRFTVPLRDGRVEVRELIAELSKEAGIELPDALADLNSSFDVQGFLGKSQLKAIERLVNGAILIEVNTDRLTVTIDNDAIHGLFADAERKAREWTVDPAQTDAGQSKYGLSYIRADDSIQQTPEQAVVLVHGLDDPGIIWDELISHLLAAKHQVAIFSYPNDGPIGESADLLVRTLETEHGKGLKRVDVVAHSMGGLVVRDALTRPGHYDGDGSGNQRYPAIDRLIMIGTPNHGSRLAKYRFVTQAGEQVSRMVKGQGLAPVEPGSGEAGIDLLPDSDALRRLNNRPLASHTKHTIIAGQWLTIDANRLQQFLQGALETVEAGSNDPAWRRWLSQQNMIAASQTIEQTGEAIGDGCVSMDSARLEGVDDFVIVRGNHVSIMWNGPLSDDVPPAIPVVLERLQAPIAP